MNYRQWKKNYKKKHGHNPTLEEDKRKQCKVVRAALKALPRAMENIATALSNIAQAFIKAAETIKDIKIPNYCENPDCANCPFPQCAPELVENFKKQALESEGI